MKNPKLLLLIVIVGVGITASLACAKVNETAPKKGAKTMDTIQIESRAFKHMQPVPARYTCDGADISPPLSWSKLPAAAKSIVLICDDPDAPAGTWVHWVVYDLLPTIDSLPENVPKIDSLPMSGKQGKTDFNRVGWNGPCPPGGTHRYFFKIYGLDTMLNLPSGKTKHEIEKTMKGHVVVQGELVGTYSRNNKK
jgi:Raf kinase inhibitor-like YbhB/YbcL family protein